MGYDASTCQNYLVGGLEHSLFFHILGIITPSDEYISERLKPPTSYCRHAKRVVPVDMPNKLVSVNMPKGLFPSTCQTSLSPSTCQKSVRRRCAKMMVSVNMPRTCVRRHAKTTSYSVRVLKPGNFRHSPRAGST